MRSGRTRGCERLCRAVVDAGREFRGVDSIPDAVEYMLSAQALGKVVVAL